MKTILGKITYLSCLLVCSSTWAHADIGYEKRESSGNGKSYQRTLSVPLLGFGHLKPIRLSDDPEAGPSNSNLDGADASFDDVEWGRHLSDRTQDLMDEQEVLTILGITPREDTKIDLKPIGKKDKVITVLVGLLKQWRTYGERNTVFRGDLSGGEGTFVEFIKKESKGVQTVVRKMLKSWKRTPGICALDGVLPSEFGSIQLQQEYQYKALECQMAMVRLLKEIGDAVEQSSNDMKRLLVSTECLLAAVFKDAQFARQVIINVFVLRVINPILIRETYKVFESQEEGTESGRFISKLLIKFINQQFFREKELGSILNPFIVVSEDSNQRGIEPFSVTGRQAQLMLDRLYLMFYQ